MSTPCDHVIGFGHDYDDRAICLLSEFKDRLDWQPDIVHPFCPKCGERHGYEPPAEEVRLAAIQVREAKRRAALTPEQRAREDDPRGKIAKHIVSSSPWLILTHKAPFPLL